MIGNFLEYLDIPPSLLMRYALVGDGVVKQYTSSHIAAPGSGFTYERAAHAITKVNSNRYMIEYMKRVVPFQKPPIPDKYLADLLEAVIGFWFLEGRAVADQLCKDYTQWAIKRYEREYADTSAEKLRTYADRGLAFASAIVRSNQDHEEDPTAVAATG